MHPTAMSKHQSVRDEGTTASGSLRRMSLPGRATGTAKPYFPSNPSRKKKTSELSIDLYSQQKSRQQKLRQKEKLLSRARSDSPPQYATSAHNNKGLDDVAPPCAASRRQSRWESDGLKETSKHIPVPQRRRPSCSPDPVERPRRSSAPVSTQPLRMARRKLSGDLDHPTSFYKAAAANADHNHPIVRKNRKPISVVPKTTSLQDPNKKGQSSSRFGTMLGEVLNKLELSYSEEEEHDFLRRSQSNKFMFIRDDSTAEVGGDKSESPLPNDSKSSYNKNQKLQFRRRSDVGPLRIPAAFAHETKSTQRKRDPIAILSRLNLDNSKEDDDDDIDVGVLAPARDNSERSSDSDSQLGQLVKSMDESDESNSHIFCSQRHLVTFADDSDEE